jgi:hypothetical protein
MSARFLAVVAVLSSCLASAAEPGPWIMLFDGQSTARWHTPSGRAFPAECWRVEDGALKPEITAGGKSDIWTDETFRSFELEFEFKTAPGANGGIKYLIQRGSASRSRNGKYVGPAASTPAEPGDFINESSLGFEYQILDDTANPEGSQPKTKTAALYQLLPSTNDAPAKPGVFHRGRIVVDGDRIEHHLDGKLVMRTRVASPELEAAFDERKGSATWRALTRRESPIVITHHRTPVWYRNVRVRRLP